MCEIFFGAEMNKDKDEWAGLPEHLRPAKEEDAPEGYMICNECNGQKVVGPDGTACICARYGQYAGYMKILGPEKWRCPKCSYKYKSGPYYLCLHCGYKDPKYYDYRWSTGTKVANTLQILDSTGDEVAMVGEYRAQLLVDKINSIIDENEKFWQILVEINNCRHNTCVKCKDLTKGVINGTESK
jgi:hypothetical protein